GYGRGAEMESDALGVMNAYEAGYNPKGMVRFLKHLRQKEIFSGQSYHSYRATHPETKERILKMEMFSSSLLNRGKKVVNNRNAYLSKIEGIDYGGKRYKNDRRRYKKIEQIALYEIQPGDTFASIALKELQEERKAMEIAILNGKKDTDPLKPGLIIKLVKSKKPRPDINLEIKPKPNGKTKIEGADPPQNPLRLSR
ncbi:MAG: M48 family metalloprotease, partial [Nitrospinales bacterium]